MVTILIHGYYYYEWHDYNYYGYMNTTIGWLLETIFFRHSERRR